MLLGSIKRQLQLNIVSIQSAIFTKNAASVFLDFGVGNGDSMWAAGNRRSALVRRLRYLE
jgi:hypothetical protein